MPWVAKQNVSRGNVLSIDRRPDAAFRARRPSLRRSVASSSRALSIESRDGCNHPLCAGKHACVGGRFPHADI